MADEQLDDAVGDGGQPQPVVLDLTDVFDAAYWDETKPQTKQDRYDGVTVHRRGSDTLLYVCGAMTLKFRDRSPRRAS